MSSTLMCKDSPAPFVRELRFCPIVVAEGDEEPVHVEREPIWLLLAAAESDRLVELSRSREIAYVAIDA
jgi:hypothetical protein